MNAAIPPGVRGRSALAAGEGAREMVQEAAIMAQVPNHENLVSLIGVVTTGSPLLCANFSSPHPLYAKGGQNIDMTCRCVLGGVAALETNIAIDKVETHMQKETPSR